MMWDKINRVAGDKGNVWKYVFEAKDAVAESVLYRYPDFKTRTVICCSTQSGCPVGCRFCGAGDAFVRSLTGDEITSQVVHLLMQVKDELTSDSVDANEMGRLQIMFMSMGEPLLNKTGLIDALRSLYQRYPAAALLISTSAPDVDYAWVEAISKEIPTIGLQFSVHESSDEARNKLIPFAKKLSLTQIATAGESWAASTGRRPFFNYCAHAGNTANADVDRLYALFDPAVWECTVSVICERDEHVAAANERQRALAQDFMSKMVQKGYSTRCFDPAGQDDIGGGCGQLWFVQDWMSNNAEKVRPSVGRGLPVIHTPL